MARGISWHRAACLVILLLTSVGVAHARVLNAKQVLQKAARPYSAVKDYSVNARFTAKSESMHIPDMMMKIYWKTPDKIHLESKDGFAILPRQGVIFGNPVGELMKASDVRMAKPEEVQGIKCYVVKASFQREGRTANSTVWIDKKDHLIRQISRISEFAPAVKVMISYIKIDGKYWMPESTQATITSPIIPNDQPRELLNQRRGQPMTVKVKFWDYRINQGLRDDIFEQEG